LNGDGLAGGNALPVGVGVDHRKVQLDLAFVCDKVFNGERQIGQRVAEADGKKKSKAFVFRHFCSLKLVVLRIFSADSNVRQANPQWGGGIM